MVTKYAEFDTSEDPVVYVKFSSVKPTVDAFDDYLNDMRAILDNKKRVIMLFDSSNSNDAENLSSNLLIKQAKWIKENKEDIGKYVDHNIFVIPSRILRVVFNCILGIQRIPAPYVVLSSKDEAFRFVNEKIYGKTSNDLSIANQS